MSNLVEITDLKKYFPVKGKRNVTIKAVDGVTFNIPRGKSFGLVGESGCGKTTTARVLIRLYHPTSGSIIFDGKDTTQLKGEELHQYRRNIQMVFQDPYASLNPRMTVARTLMDPLDIYKVGSPQEREERVQHLMELVGLDPRFARRFPHEFSGGQRQRIGIARALALDPKLMVLDEPVSALDVSIQSQILNLMKTLQSDLGLTYLFISHNLGVVDYMCEEIAVMYLGRIVEQADRKSLFESPQHPYTKALLSAVPSMRNAGQKEKILLKGDIPSPANPPSGCSFHTRCEYACDICKEQAPPATSLSDSHLVYCWKMRDYQ